MYRPRDITDSIATVAIILMIVATIIFVLISILGFQIPSIEPLSGSVDTSLLDSLLQAPFGFNFNSMDSPSKLLFGAVIGLMFFLLITLVWAFWYRRRGINK